MTSSNNVYEAIVAGNENFMGTFSRGDAAGLAALYTEKGQVLSTHSDFVTGRWRLRPSGKA